VKVVVNVVIIVEVVLLVVMVLVAVFASIEMIMNMNSRAMTFLIGFNSRPSIQPV
jgi:hypothetical protein